MQLIVSRFCDHQASYNLKDSLLFYTQANAVHERISVHQKQQRATQDIMVNPEARPSIQQHNKEMHALLTGKTSHHHISRTAQAPEQKIRTHFKMPPRK